MLSVLSNAWKVPEIRKKLLWTLFLLAVIRVLAHIPIPGLDQAALDSLLNANNADGATLYNIISGGAFSRMSIFAMGVGPYITSSIIMQLLTIAIPQLEQMQKEGEAGRKKIQKITRYGTVVLGLIQAIALTYSYHNLFVVQNLWMYIVSVASLITTTAFAMWLGEEITKIGMGNGTSMIIFINILSSIPNGINVLVLAASGGSVWNIAKVIIMLIIFLFIIAFVVLAQVGERRIPVQYSKKMLGRKMPGGQSSYIPIKVNIAGVISIIFAISLLQFPQTIGQFMATRPAWLSTVITWLGTSHPFGACLYIILIIVFTYFYTSIVFNPAEIAENMKKNGGFVPGIRPGKPTSDFITKVAARITLIGALCYAAIALIPVVLEWVFKIGNVGFGGTTLLIVVGVALETVKQLESQLLMRHYKGFLKE